MWTRIRSARTRRSSSSSRSTSPSGSSRGVACPSAFLPPGIAVLLYLTFLYIPLIDPQHRNYAAFAGALRALRLLVVGFLVFVHVLVVLASLGVDVHMDTAMRAALPLLFAGIGALLPGLKPN